MKANSDTDDVDVPAQAQLCDPILDLWGLCHCPYYPPAHVPVLGPNRGQSFPACRDPCLRLLYIDDALIATPIRVDHDCVPLLPTEGPHGRLASCGLGIPGSWLQLQHRIRDVDANAQAIGMKLN